LREKESETVKGENRRGFLRSLGMGAVVGGAAMAAGAGTVVADEKPAKDGTGYRETEHVRTYYDLARF